MSSPAPPWPAPGLPSMPPTSFSDMTLWRSWPWSLLKFLLRSWATIQPLSRLTERAEAGGWPEEGGDLVRSVTPFLGRTPSFAHLLGRLIQLAQILKLPGGGWGGGRVGVGRELRVSSKMPAPPLLLPPLGSLPSQRLRPECLCQRPDQLCHAAGGLTHSHARGEVSSLCPASSQLVLKQGLPWTVSQAQAPANNCEIDSLWLLTNLGPGGTPGEQEGKFPCS